MQLPETKHTKQWKVKKILKNIFSKRPLAVLVLFVDLQIIYFSDVLICLRIKEGRKKSQDGKENMKSMIPKHDKRHLRNK